MTLLIIIFLMVAVALVVWLLAKPKGQRSTPLPSVEKMEPPQKFEPPAPPMVEPQPQQEPKPQPPPTPTPPPPPSPPAPPAKEPPSGPPYSPMQI